MTRTLLENLLRAEARYAAGLHAHLRPLSPTGFLERPFSWMPPMAQAARSPRDRCSRSCTLSMAQLRVARQSQ